MARADSRMRPRRRRQGRTDYHRRLKLLRSEKARAVVRLTNRRVIVQIVEYEADGDKVLITVDGETLVRDFGWPKDASRKSIPACRMAGYAAGKMAIAAGVSSAVLDIGLANATPGNRRFAALKGLLEAGMDVPHSEDILPSEERADGQHISAALVKAVQACVTKIDEVVG